MKANIFRIQAYDSIVCGYFCIGFIDFMLAGKTLIEFINLFSPNNLKKWWYYSKLFYDKYLKMAERSSAECNSYETHNLYPNSGDQRQFRLNKINGIKYYFVVEIKEIELMSKRLSKYIAFFWLFWQIINCFICNNR